MGVREEIFVIKVLNLRGGSNKKGNVPRCDNLSEYDNYSKTAFMGGGHAAATNKDSGK